jgi:hypothetical protein
LYNADDQSSNQLKGTTKLIANNWYNENGRESPDFNDNRSGKYDNEEYRERIKMKIKQIIGDRSFSNLIKDAIKELMAEI